MTAPAPQLSRLGRAAVRYAEQGWAVFPLVPGGKVPLRRGEGGFLSATVDQAQIRAWWTETPDANIGLYPGRSALVVLDLDGPDGEHTAAGLGVLSEPTLTVVTGRADGGRHLYYHRPPFAVSNCDLGPKLDVRGDAGYVIVPPSVHPSGAVYAWQGTAADLRPLPERAAAALKAAQDGLSRALPGALPGAPTPSGRAAREIALEPDIGEGGRNNALTRYAGRLLAKGIPEDETLTLVLSLNAAKCRPPLPPAEVTALVTNVAHREAQKRTTPTGVTLALVDAPRADREAPEAPAPDALPTPGVVAQAQVDDAQAMLGRDLRAAPRWAWSDLDGLTGPMLPGDLVIVGALMGNGKSALLMSQMDAFADARTPTLYIPLEVDPATVRLRWAAWKLRVDVRAVLRQEWGALPEGTRDAIHSLLEEQAASPCVHFAPPKRLTLAGLTDWCRWAKEHVGARVVMLDHLHRLEVGGDAAGHRVAVTEVVRRMKDMARDLGLVLVAAAQLNRSSEPVDAYLAPQLARLKESAGIAEEADVVLMLSRALRRDLPDKWSAKLRVGQLNERDLSEPGVMVVTCRKHRLDDEALNRSVRLAVVNGHLESLARTWQAPPSDAAVSDGPKHWYDRD